VGDHSERATLSCRNQTGACSYSTSIGYSFGTSTVAVVIYQIRRRNKLLKLKENDLRRQTRGPGGGKRERTEKRAHDLERGVVVVEAHAAVSGCTGELEESDQGERDEDYTDDEDIDEEKVDYDKVCFLVCPIVENFSEKCAFQVQELITFETYSPKEAHYLTNLIRLVTSFPKAT